MDDTYIAILNNPNASWAQLDGIPLEFFMRQPHWLLTFLQMIGEPSQQFGPETWFNTNNLDGFIHDVVNLHWRYAQLFQHTSPEIRDIAYRYAIEQAPNEIIHFFLEARYPLTDKQIADLLFYDALYKYNQPIGYSPGVFRAVLHATQDLRHEDALAQYIPLLERFVRVFFTEPYRLGMTRTALLRDYPNTFTDDDALYNEAFPGYSAFDLQMARIMSLIFLNCFDELDLQYIKDPVLVSHIETLFHSMQTSRERHVPDSKMAKMQLFLHSMQNRHGRLGLDTNLQRLVVQRVVADMTAPPTTPTGDWTDQPFVRDPNFATAQARAETAQMVQSRQRRTSTTDEEEEEE